MARFVTELMLRLIDGASAPARQAAASIGNITKAIRENNTAALTASSKALGRQMASLKVDLLGASASLVAYAAALAAPIKASQEFESKLTDIGQKADLTRRQTKAMGQELMTVGRQVNQTAGDLADGVDTLAGLGLPPDMAMRLIRPIGQAATAYKAQIADLASASYAAVSNLKVPVDQTGRVLDIMALAGKRGAFELKDMAQYMPALAAAAQGLGQEGVPAVADLAAALQIARKGAGDSAEAATNVGNLLQKVTAPSTVRAFKKMGVDLVGSLKALEREGRTPIEAIAELTNKTLAGDMSRLGYLFEDAQVQKALRPLIKDLEEYRAIRADALKADGTVKNDFAERMKDGAEQARRFKVQTSNLALTIGAALLPPLNEFLSVVTPLIAKVADFAAAHPKLTSAILLSVGGLMAFRAASIAVQMMTTLSKQGLVDMALGFGKLGGFARKAGEQVILAAVGSALNVRMFIGSLRGASIAGFGRALMGLLPAFSAVRLGFFTLNTALISTGIGAIIVGLGLAAVFIIQHWRGFVTYFQGIGRGFTSALAPIMPALEPLIGALKAFGGWIASFFKSNPGEDWSKFGFAVGQALAWPIVTLMNFATWVGECIARVREFFGIKGKPPQVTVEQMRDFASGKPPPGRARGGGVEAGQDYMVGEEGPEIVRFPRRGRVYPTGTQPPAAGGRGGGVFAPSMSFHVYGQQDPEGFVREVMRRLRDEFRTWSDASFSDSDLRSA